VAVVVLAIAPAPAIATPEDVAATHAYIQANYALARASVARIAPAQARIERLNKELSSECPRIGEGSPEDEAAQPVSYDVAVALWSLAYGTDAEPIRNFVSAVGRLRFSNHAIAHAAEAYARSLHELATLPLPSLCAEVGSWKQSAFQVIPAATAVLVRRVEAVEPRPVAPRLLAPYERGGDATTVVNTMRLERRLEEEEFIVGQNDWFQVLETLGLNQ
jgi:hypothetical protein